jgi:hypothetical protein
VEINGYKHFIFLTLHFLAESCRRKQFLTDDLTAIKPVRAEMLEDTTVMGINVQLLEVE